MFLILKTSRHPFVPKMDALRQPSARQLVKSLLSCAPSTGYTKRSFGSLVSQVALALVLALMPRVMQAQLVVTNTQTPAQLVQNILLGGGVSASNITFNGLPANTITEQVGFFNSANANVGITEGLILATGNVMNALGPNSSGSASMGGGNFGQTDPDLEILAGGGVGINDAAVLEFDFVVTGDSLKFNFVFGSDEYLEFVNSINDAFGFFLSGPGITGPFSNNAINIALVPGTADPITINSVNDVVNSAYYVVNGTGANAPYNASPFYVQYDGLTVVMTASAQVICGETYHIKIAVGDASDTVWDSAVFLEAGSFVSTGQVIPDLQASLLLNDSTMLEGCGPVEFTFYRVGDTTNTDTINMVIGGTATPGVDYLPPFPNQLIFNPGDTAITIVLTVPLDADGLETITFQIEQVIQCAGQNVITNYTYYIDQPPPLNVQVSNIVTDCDLVETLAPAVSGGSGFYSFDWNTGQTTPTIDVSPGVTTTYTVTVSDSCAVLPVTVDIEVEVPVYPPITIDVSPDTAIPCLGNADISVIAANGGNGVYTYEWTLNGAVLGTNATQNVPAGPPTYYVVTVTDGCGSSVQDSVLTTTAPLPPIEITTAGDVTVLCTGDTTTLAVVNVTGGNGVYSYQWTNSNGVVLSTGPTVTVPVPTDHIYTVTVADQCGYSGSALVASLVPNPLPLVIDLTPDQTICFGDSIALWAQVSGGSGVYTIEWVDLDHSDPVLMVAPEQATNYVVNVYEACGLFSTDDVTIEVEQVELDIVVNIRGQDDWYLLAACDPEPQYYFWDWGDGTKDFGKEVYHSYLNLEEHWVTLQVYTFNGCRAVDSVFLKPPAHLYFPNVFTPDGDGINEMFGPVGHYIDSFEMTIFDRWGAEVYTTKDFNKPWDGTVKGSEPAQTGVYVYKYRATGHYFPATEGYGHVTLIRGTN